jgi:hypothetical protein
MSEQRKAVIKNADMSDQMQQDAVDIASKALSEYSIEKVRVRVASLFEIWLDFSNYQSYSMDYQTGCRGIY